MYNLKDLLNVSCKHCNSGDTVICDDAIQSTDFSDDGTGHCYMNSHCNSCGGISEIVFSFKYEITSIDHL